MAAPTPSRNRRSTAVRAACFGLALAVGVGLVPLILSAQVSPGVNGFTEATGLRSADVRLVIIRIIQVLLGFLGIVATSIVLYGGYLWMTAAGNEPRLELAKQVLKNGLIGLTIILSAFLIVSYIFRQFQLALTGTGGPGGPGACTNCAALGGGIIQDHFPGRNQRDVPRNTAVIITFKEPIKVVSDADATAPNESFILHATSAGCPTCWQGDVNASTFELLWDDASPPAVTPMAVATTDLRTFVFRPTGLLGSPDRETRYKATVRGKPTAGGPGLTKADGTPGLTDTYDWLFWVSTVIDTTPPRITGILPYDRDRSPRSTAVLVDFDEPVNPLSASGVWDGATNVFDNLAVVDGGTVTGSVITGGTTVSGRFELVNGYRTIQFLSDQACGTNSCGGTIYCLPENSALAVAVKAPTLHSDPACTAPADPTSNPSLACSPMGARFFDGVADVAGNALDGQRRESPPGTLTLPSGDGDADGPPADSFTWTFDTDDTVVTTGPRIESVAPTPDSGGTSIADPFHAQFNRRLLGVASSPDPADPTGPPLDPVRIYEGEVADPPVPFAGPYWPRQSAVAACSLSGTACTKNLDCAGGLDFCGKDDVAISHGTFAVDQEYEPRLSSAIKDFTQNCFYPSTGPLPNTRYPPPGPWPDRWIDPY